jgi:hypothetical protein
VEVAVVPVLIVLGMVAGHWWRAALVVGGLGWVVALSATDVIGTGEVPVALALAVLNTAVGIGLHRLAAAMLRRARA